MTEQLNEAKDKLKEQDKFINQQNNVLKTQDTLIQQVQQNVQVSEIEKNKIIEESKELLDKLKDLDDKNFELNNQVNDLKLQQANKAFASSQDSLMDLKGKERISQLEQKNKQLKVKLKEIDKIMKNTNELV